MRRLILLRHAKAAPASGGVKDFERPLTERGRRETVAVARDLDREGFAPDLALVSSARRAKETWAHAAQLFPQADVELRAGLYEAPPGAILDEIGSVAHRAQTLVVVGHNPGLQELAVTLVQRSGGSASDARTLGESFPTATAAVFVADGEGRLSLEAIFHPERAARAGG